MTFLRPVSEQRQPQRFVFLLLDGFTHLSLTCATEPLRLANQAADAPLFRWEIVSVDGMPVRAACGTAVMADAGLANLSARDTLVVVAGERPLRPAPAPLPGFLRRQHAHGATLIGLCGGAEVLAEAGLLDGQDCAVTLPSLAGFAERHPGVAASGAVFALGRICTAATGLAAADLMLHLLAARHGCDLANAVADMMSYVGARPPGTSQRISLYARHGFRNQLLAAAIAIMEENADEALRVADISARLGVSVRQIERLFTRYLNETPNRHYLKIRLKRARSLLRDTQLSVTEVSVACGFRTATHFTRSYRAQFGTSPHRFRMVEMAG